MWGVRTWRDPDAQVNAPLKNPFWLSDAQRGYGPLDNDSLPKKKLVEKGLLGLIKLKLSGYPLDSGNPN
jgi:hypothetical protein